MCAFLFFLRAAFFFSTNHNKKGIEPLLLHSYRVRVRVNQLFDLLLAHGEKVTRDWTEEASALSGTRFLFLQETNENPSRSDWRWQCGGKEERKRSLSRPVAADSGIWERLKGVKLLSHRCLEV